MRAPAWGSGLAALLVPVGAAAAEARDASGTEHRLTLFVVQIALLLLAGRLLGEVMHRLGQPAVMGQLLAGIVLGPSLLGLVAPAVSRTIFPVGAEQTLMLEAISHLGVLLLLLLSGMETDLGLVRQMRRTAAFSSAAGMLAPFALGVFAGMHLPAALFPHADARLVTSLFIATCLAVSSVKIVAMIVLEAGFSRRNIGQVILATAILDDTLAWVLVGLISGFAASGTVDPLSVGTRVLGVALFLLLSLTVGRRAVTFLIRWVNDHFRIEVPVVTAILVVTFTMSVVTERIGVHDTLGAFVAGILIGQSPILTRHIENQLRGTVMALFAPVFFAAAGLSIDLRILADPPLLAVAAVFILVASAGKMLGGFLGGRLGRLTARESTALAIGMNARGSTEVIVAKIGLAMGMLTQDLFTLVVITAVTTTLVTPPLLRWALERIPPTGEEKERLEREEAEAREFVPNVERLLVATDASADGALASILAGLLGGARKIDTSVLSVDGEPAAAMTGGSARPPDVVRAAAETGTRRARAETSDRRPDVPTMVEKRPASEAVDEAVLEHAGKGYDLVFLGLRHLPARGRGIRLHPALEKILPGLGAASAIAVARHAEPPVARTLRILVAGTGADYSRRAIEVAVAIAKGSSHELTALHVARASADVSVRRLRSDLTSTAWTIMQDIQDLGRRERVRVEPMIKIRRLADEAIAAEARRGRYDLLVLGVKLQAGAPLFFGNTVEALLATPPCSMLLVTS